MRSTPLLLLLLPMLVVGICSCHEEDPFLPTGFEETVDRTNAAFVRIIHASATAPAAVAVVDNRELFGGAAQRYLKFETRVNEGHYYPMDTSSTRLSFRTTGGEIASLTDMDLVKGGYYTFYLHGNQSGFGVMRTRDTVFPKPGTDNTRIRVVNLVPGSTAMNIHFGENQPPVIENLGYAEVREYALLGRNQARSGLYITDRNRKKLFGIPPEFLPIPPDEILTLVMTGSLEPKGDEPFLSFSALSESYYDSNRDRLYGGGRFPLDFAAVRFANLVPMIDSTLSVSFLDSAIEYYAPNQYFRRNLLGQPDALVQVSPLGNNRALGMHTMRGYMFLGTLLTTRYPYRMEIGLGSAHDPAPQTVLADSLPGRGFEFNVTANRRYTIVAYGPKVVSRARSGILRDNTRAPSTPAMTTFRFFHGGFGAGTEERRLKVRINGVESPAMRYGELPDGATQAAEAAGGATTIELLDEGGATLHTEHLDDPMKAGNAYTIFLSRGALGTSLVLTEVSDAFTLVY